MAKDNFKEIVGKTISGVVVKERDHTKGITWHMYLFFTDGTSIEFYRHDKADWLDCSKIGYKPIEDFREEHRGRHGFDGRTVVDSAIDDD